MSINILVDNDVFFSAINDRTQNHARARAWLNKAKPAGWGIAVETYLCALRLLMNPVIMGANVQSADAAIAAIDLELSGPHPGHIIFAKEKPDTAIIGRAQGHKQVMDYWLVQIARQEGCRLATLDAGTLANWPDVAMRV